MIRTLPLVCSNCDNKFVPDEELYYRDNFMSNSIRDVHFICPDCIKRWKDKWRIKTAVFSEKDYVMTVSITLEDGTIYKNLDCTPLEELLLQVKKSQKKHSGNYSAFILNGIPNAKRIP